MSEPLIAMVKMNGSQALVLAEKPKMEYWRNGNAIVGTDGCFVSCLYYERDRWAKAFAGRKFTLTMADGEVIECSGQWWHGIHEDAYGILPRGEEIGHIAAGGIDELMNCYVFTGYETIKSKVDKMIASYTGFIHNYWEYDTMLRLRKRVYANRAKPAGGET